MKLLTSKFYIIISISILFIACNSTSDTYIKSVLKDYGVLLIAEPNFTTNDSHIKDDNVFIELKLSEREFESIKNQIVRSKGFAKLSEYEKGLIKFKTKPWTYRAVFNSNNDQAIDQLYMEDAYYHQEHQNEWVEKIDDYSKRIGFYKCSSGKYGGEIFIEAQTKKLFFTIVSN